MRTRGPLEPVVKFLIDANEVGPAVGTLQRENGDDDAGDQTDNRTGDDAEREVVEGDHGSTPSTVSRITKVAVAKIPATRASNTRRMSASYSLRQRAVASARAARYLIEAPPA
jgi:hypothetical protein